jgi:hypothetical protein
MTIETEVAALTTAVNALTATVDVKKATLDASVSTAAISATASSSSASASATSAQTAQGQASLAQGYALSASSVVQQDLSGVTAQALHRSPNAITAMSIYDTSKDSDGGAWTKKCQQTSWYNEALAGKWLGPQFNEAFARYSGGTVGAELITNGNFSNGTTGWTASTYGSSTISASNNVLRVTETGAHANAAAGQTFPVTSGKTYRVTFDVVSNTSSQGIGCWIGSGYGAANWLYSNVTYGYSFPGRSTFYFTAAGATAYFELIGYFTLGGTSEYFEVANVSVREVTALTTASNDYFQLTTDGKFYRLWRNMWTYPNDFANAAWTKTRATVSAAVGIAAPAGGPSTVTKLVASSNSGVAGTHTLHRIVPYITLGPNGRYSSIHVKAAGLTAVDWYDINMDVGFRVNLTTGVLSESPQHAGKYNAAKCSSVSLGDGWYRIILGGETNTPNNPITLSLVSGGVQSFIGDDASGVYITGAQIEYAPSLASVGAYEDKPIAAVGASSASEIFRGNKAEFPKLAAIVAEATSVNIYDLTEPGRPMWMRFWKPGNDSIFNFLSHATTPVSSITALNGYVAVGQSGGVAYYGHLRVANFAADQMRKYTGFYGTNYVSPAQISQRNDNAVTFQLTADPGNDGPGIGSNGSVNAIAMTVLPDAPIDPATGLRVPTIAVATSGGVSVIKQDGSVVTIASGNTFHVSISPQYRMAYGFFPGLIAGYRTVSLIGIQSGSAANGYVTNGAPEGSITKTFSANSVFASLAPGRGIVLRKEHPASSNKSLVAYAFPTYNTGWMTGDIRRAYLSDVTAESIGPGTNVVSNGDFASDVSGWSAFNGGSVAWASGAAVVTGAGANTTGVIQPITCVIGRTYRFQVTCTLGTATVAEAAINATAVGGGGSLGTTYGYFASSQTFVGYFVATATTHSVVLMPRGVGLTATFDNVIVQEAVLDRSYKAALASLTGTITKSQLATGTSLVGYSGYSASNYLREAYSADLDFGTGEFTASAWVNIPVTLPAYSTVALGPELVTNGTFDSSTGWSLGSGWAVSGGQLVATSVAGYAFSTFTNTAILPYRVYKLSFNCTVTSGDLGFGTGNGGQNIDLVSATGSYTRYITATEASTNALYFRGNPTFTGTVDNVSLKELVPYCIADRASSSGPRIRLIVDASGRLTAEAFDGTTTRTVTTYGAYNTAQWRKAEANYTTDGSLTIRVNGREAAVTRGTPLLTMNNSSAVLTIGNSYTLDAPFPGSIALLKLGATVPTTEQSQFMYEQEKQLFRAGAQSVLPDSGIVEDMAYDDATDRWVAVSGTNESYWTGLVRNSVTPVPAGTYTKIVATSGVELNSRITSSPGVDVTIPAYGLRAEMINKAEAAARLGKELSTFDYVGGFTGNTTSGSTAIASVSTITYPGSYIGARISGSGIPANTTIVAVSGTTLYISAAATATATGVSITFLDFALPAGMQAKVVMSAGAVKQEGSTKDYTRLYDGFIETIRFGAAPGATTWVQIQAQRISQ